MSRMYAELAQWWPLLSAPHEYAEEADFYWQQLAAASRRPVRTLLELGSGGGNNASHPKRHAAMTLVEPAAGMRAVSAALNPEPYPRNWPVGLLVVHLCVAAGLVLRGRRGRVLR